MKVARLEQDLATAEAALHSLRRQCAWHEVADCEAEIAALTESLELARQEQSSEWAIAGLCSTCGGSDTQVVDGICEPCMDKYCRAMAGGQE